MTDHRDAPRLSPVELPPGAGGLDPALPPPLTRPFARLVDAHRNAHRLSLRRLATWLGLAAAALLVLAILGTHVLRSALDWLARQPAYQVPFGTLSLEPPPPPWIKSGARGLLEEVRRRSDRPGRLSSLALDLDQLAADFQRESPWVRAVREIVIPDRNHVVVRLEYREPVAALNLGTGRRIVVDRDAVVLPADELDLRSAAPLVLLVGFLPPGATVVPLAGRSLIVEPAAPGPGAAPRPGADPALLAPLHAAARLAAFFRERGADRSGTGAPPAVIAIHNSSKHLFVEAEGGAMILWGPLPGAERPGAATDPEKWASLLRWLKDNRLQDLKNPDFLDFDRDRAFVRHPKSPT